MAAASVRGVAAKCSMIRIEPVWLAVEPLDMRAGAQARSPASSTSSVRPAHHAYLFANAAPTA